MAANQSDSVWEFLMIIYRDLPEGRKEMGYQLTIDGKNEEHARRRVIKHVQQRGYWVRTLSLVG